MPHLFSSDDTIFAFASGVGRAGIAVLRVSGRCAGDVLRSIAGPLPKPRHASLRLLRDPGSGEPIDQGLVLWFPGPASFTGEDQVEFHIHGGVAVKAAMLACLGRSADCRPAEPGEFTRRAFVNGRMDLSAVEGLADLVDAETEAQRRQGLRQAEGGLTRQSEQWREALIGIAARLEAALDFSDEADVTQTVVEQARRSISDLSSEFETQLTSGRRGERLRDGFRVVLAGPPNAGKSTLMNALARRDVAIVSAIPGTTRDAIEVRCDLGGLPVEFVDTAGLRDEGEELEREGMRRTRQRMQTADLVLWLAPPDIADHPPEGPATTITIATKLDLGRTHMPAELAISCVTGEGMQALLDLVEREASRALVGHGDALLTRERHRVAVAEAHGSLLRASHALDRQEEELAAEDVRLAIRAIGRISGRVDAEDVLERIFSQFCIGK